MIKKSYLKTTTLLLAIPFFMQSLFAEKTIYDLFKEKGITESKCINFGAEKSVFEIKIGEQTLACLYFNPTLYNNAKYYMKELRFLQEAKKHKKENPEIKINIIGYKGYLSEDYNYSIFTELAEQDLDRYIFDKTKKSNLSTKIKLLINIASGIKYMHNLGYVHRDIKTKNIVIKKDTAKLIDFTMYKKIPLGETYVYTKKIKGSMDYICPEHIIRQHRKELLKVEPANDIYSFGILIYSLLYEKHFDDDLIKELIKDESDRSRFSFENINKRFDNPEYRLTYLNYWINKKWRPSLDKTVPEQLNDLIKLCWNHKPKNRPSIDNIMEQLTIVENQLGIESEEI